MKKTIKGFFIILLLLPIVIFADRTFEDGVDKANKFVYTINEYNRYFNTSEDLPYIFDESDGIKYSNLFKKGGFLNYYELEIASSNNKESSISCYLTPGIEYWLADRKRVSTTLMNDDTLTSGVRITEFIRPDIETTGNGSNANPWTLQSGYSVVIGTNNKSYGTITPTRIDHIEKGSTKTYIFNINTVDGFDYNLDNCTKGITSRNATISEENKKITVTNVTGNVNCYVKFEPKCLKISFDDQNASDETKGYEGHNYYFRYGIGWYADNECSIPLDIKLPNTLPRKKGHTFEGYYTGKTIDDKGLAFITKDNLIEIKTTTLKTNTTIYAVYKPKEYILNYGGYETNGSCSNCTSKVVTYGQVYGTLGTPTANNGYKFIGWKLDDNYVTKDSIVEPINDENSTIVLTADISPKSYTITFDPNGGTLTNNTKTVTYTKKYGELPVPTKNGYNLEGWYTAKTGGTKVTSETINNTIGNHTLYARYKDDIAPTCSITKTSTGSESGVSVKVTCSDAGSGCATGTQTDSGLKSDKTYTVYDDVGNVGTCTASISKYDCHPYDYVCGQHVCGQYECGSYVCGSYACGSYVCGSYACGTHVCDPYGGRGSATEYTCTTYCDRYCTSYCDSLCTKYCDSYCDTYCTGYNTCYK